MRPELPPTNKCRKALDSMKAEDIDKEKSEMSGGSDVKKRRVQRCRDFKDDQTRVAEMTTRTGEIGKHDQATGTSKAARRTTTPSRNQIADGMDKNNFRSVRTPVHEAVCEGWAKPVRRKRSVVTCKRALINQFNQNVNSNSTFGSKWTSLVNLFSSEDNEKENEGLLSDSSTAHPGSLKVCQRARKILGIKRFNEGLSPASDPDNEPSPALVFKDKETKFLEKEMKKVHRRDYANQDDNKSNEGSTDPAKLQRAVSTGSLVPKADLPEEAGKCSHGNVGPKKPRRAGRPPSGRLPNRRAIRCTRLKPSAQVRDDDHNEKPKAASSGFKVGDYACSSPSRKDMEPTLGAVFSEDEIYLREQGIPMHEDSIQGEKLSSSCEVSFKANEAIVRKGLVYDSSLFEKVLLALIGEDDIDGVCNGVEGVDMSFQSARKDVLSHSEHFVGEIHQHDQSLSLPADVNMCRSNISDHQYQLMSLDERLLLELQSIGLLLDASPDLAEEEQEDVIEQDINENLEELFHDAHGCEVTTRLTGAPFLGYDSLQHGMRVQKDDPSKDVGLDVLSHRIIDCGTAHRRGGKRRSDRPPFYRRNITSCESVEGLAQLLPKSRDQIKETSKSKTKLIPLTINRSGRKSSGRVAPRSERHNSMPMRNTCPEDSAKEWESTPPRVESVNKLELASIAITIQHSLEELEMPNNDEFESIEDLNFLIDPNTCLMDDTVHDFASVGLDVPMDDLSEISLLF